MLKKIKTLFTVCLTLGALFANAQTYLFSTSQGYGAGVTGGGNGPVTVVTTQAALSTALKASGAARIVVQGTIQMTYLSIEAHDKTLLGMPGSKLVNNTQTKDGSGIINLKASSNVIFRNLTFEGPGAYDADGRDNLTVDGCTKIWVDHCDFQDGMDGNYDHKNGTDNITVSWCRFRYLKSPKAGGSGGTDDHRFTNLVGSNDSDKGADGLFSITWQYCWWDQGCVERMTRARNAQLHFLNCYWNTSSGKVLLGLGYSDAYVENSVFAGSGEKYRNYGGTVRLTTVGSTSPPANVGTCPAPSYSRESISASSVVAAVTGKCGAGATLIVTTAGAVSTSCGAVDPVKTYTLTTSTTGTGTVVLNPAGGTYDEGTEVTVTATPGSGFTFTGWSGALSGTTNPAKITMNSNKSVTANFAQVQTLTVPSNVAATATKESVNVTWNSVSGATGYTVNFCVPNNGTTAKKTWDFTSAWTIDATDADANLVLDVTPNDNRFNYAPATTNGELTFANGTTIPDVAGLLFTAAASKLRLGFGSQLIQLNGANISVAIPCASGDKITIIGKSSSNTVSDRGFSVAGGTLSTSESSSNINSSGIITELGGIGTWVYNATSTSLKITSVTGGMNIQKIIIGGSGTAPICTEYTVPNGSTNYTIPGLTPSTTYSYQVKATNGKPAESSAYSSSKTVTTLDPLGIEYMDAAAASRIVVYPNPSASTFQIGGIEGMATVSVSDITGKQLFRTEAVANQQISVEALQPGMYVVKITTENGAVEKKLMKR